MVTTYFLLSFQDKVGKVGFEPTKSRFLAEHVCQFHHMPIYCLEMNLSPTVWRLPRGALPHQFLALSLSSLNGRYRIADSASIR